MEQKLEGRGREKRSEKKPPVVRTKVILHLLRNEVPRSDYSQCSLATEQPSTADFRRYQNVSGVVDTRQRTSSLFTLEHVLYFSRTAILTIQLGYPPSALVPLFVSSTNTV